MKVTYTINIENIRYVDDHFHTGYTREVTYKGIDKGRTFNITGYSEEVWGYINSKAIGATTYNDAKTLLMQILKSDFDYIINNVEVRNRVEIGMNLLFNMENNLSQLVYKPQEFCIKDDMLGNKLYTLTIGISLYNEKIDFEV